MKIVRIIVINVLVFCGLLFATGIAVEVWARTRPRNTFVQFDPLLGQRLKPSTDGLYRGLSVLSPNPAIRAEVHIDSLGLHAPEIAIQKPAQTRRVVVLGDSYVQALEVPYDSTFFARLSRLATEHHTVPLQPVPMGVMGYGTAQELLWFRDNAPRLKPDLVILSLFLSNDISDNSRELFASGGRPYFDLKGDSLRLVALPNRVNRFKYEAAELLRSYMFYKELGHRIGGLHELLAKLSLSNEPANNDELTRGSDPRLPRAYQLTFALVSELRRVAASVNSPLLVAYHGKFPTGVPETSDSLVARYCAETKLDCLNLNWILAGHPEYFVPMDEHWSSAGHKAVAEEMWRAWQRYMVAPLPTTH